MAFALKLQATVGEITDFDCTGGEPADTHRTIAEIDPATDEQIAVGAQIHALLSGLDLQVTTPFGEGRLQIRKMDSDGRT